MIRIEKFDKFYIGAVAGFVIPLIIGLCIYFFSTGDKTFAEYINRIVFADILSHIISLCVFPNVFIFLAFNRFDMLRASRGVLAATIVWATAMFIIKFT